MANNLECPVDFIYVNERKIRFTAACVLILIVVYIFTGLWPIPLFLVIDFLLRAFKLGKYSPLNFISDQLVIIFALQPKHVDQAPKRFAAKIGFLFSVSIVFFIALQLNAVAVGIAIIMALFAFLESVLGFCAGCYVYTFYARFMRKQAK